MARTAKPLTPLDFAVVEVLTRHQQMCGVSQRRLAEILEMSFNCVGIILRGETPPASVGEVDALSTAPLGVKYIQEISVSKSYKN